MPQVQANRPLIKNRMMQRAVTAMALMTLRLHRQMCQDAGDRSGDRLFSVMRLSSAKYFILFLFPTEMGHVANVLLLGYGGLLARLTNVLATAAMVTQCPRLPPNPLGCVSAI